MKTNKILLLGVGFVFALSGVAHSQLVENSELKYLKFDLDLLHPSEMEMYLKIQDGKISQLEDELAIVDKALDRQKVELARYEEQAAKLRRELKSMGASSAFDEVGKDLAKHKTVLAIELVGVKARQRALVEAREKELQAGEHDVLEKKVELLSRVYSQNLQRLKRLEQLAAKGVATENEISKARVEIAQSEIDLLEQKQLLDEAKGGRSATSERLVQASVDAAQISAQLALVEDKMETWSRLQPIHAKIVTMETKLKPIKFEQVQALSKKAGELRYQIELVTLKRNRKLKEFEEGNKRREKERKPKDGESDSGKKEKVKKN